jgi:FAD/FMN-containing dehydrogenase
MTDVLVKTTAGGQAILTEATIVAFSSHLRGQALGRGDNGYERARMVWNGMVDKRPALIVRCAGVADVVEAVRFAREHDLLVSVRGGGHNIAGKAVSDGGLMIDLSAMKGVQIDPGTRTARVEGGALLGDLDREAQMFGLATTVGVVTHTGVGGLTLGGGVGRLARKHGLACDNLLAVDIVTAAGDVLRASATENDELFWGLRGGGGNFGVVTAFEFQLHPVGPAVLGGIVVHRLAKAKAALEFYRDFSRAAPDELSADAAFLTSPDGEKLFAISVCYVGSNDDAERVLEPLRRFGPPLSDQIGPAAYTDLQAAGDAFFPVGRRFYWKSHFLKEIGGDALEATVSHFARVPSPLSTLIFQQFGGAVGRVGRSETAFWHRDVEWDNFATSAWTDAAETETQLQWVREWWDLMKPFSMAGEYVNNLGDEGEDRVRASYGGNYHRLAALKDKYDPSNVFRLNANISPTV